MFRLGFKASTSSARARPPHAVGPTILSEILKATNNFDQSFLIGEGCFGNVYKAKLSNGDVVAVRRLNSISKQEATEFWKEAGLIDTLRHRNIVPVVGFYCNHEKDVGSSSMLRLRNCDNESILLYELMSKGSLNELLHEHSDSVPFTDLLKICIDVAHGLHYLHTGTKTGIIHRNLKTSNIFFDKTGTAKISGFGLSKVGTSGGSPSNVIMVPKGMLAYTDPDYFKFGKVTSKFDVYSFAVVMLELICRKPAQEIRDNDDQQNLLTWVQNSIGNGALMDIVHPDIRVETSLDILNDYFQLVETCLLDNLDQRPSMLDVVNSLETLQKRFNNSLHPVDTSVGGASTSSSPVVKEFKFNDLEKVTRGFADELLIGKSRVKVYGGWVNRTTLAPSNHVFGIGVVVQRVTSEFLVADQELQDELDLYGRLIHPSIIRFLGYCMEDETEYFLVHEHLKNSLSDFIYGDDPLSFIRRINILKSVVHAMQYLYTTEDLICHFTSKGILLDENFKAKLGSFGWAKKKPGNVNRGDMIWVDGMFGYLNTNYVTGTGRVLMKNDICSFGSVLLETITGKLPADNDLRDLSKCLEAQTGKSKKSKKRFVKNIIDKRIEGTYPIEDAYKCLMLVVKCASEHGPSREDILKSLEEIVP